MDNSLSYVVYVLINSINNKTYIGITNNTERRIRQHNKELIGGAKYTTNNKGNGVWLYYGFIKNLNKNMALSFEKKIKIKSKKMSGTPIEKRLKAINYIITDYNTVNNTNYYFELLFSLP